MKKTHNKLTCLFGHHQYSDELTVDKEGCKIRLCKICKKSGYLKSFSGYKWWRDYNEKGNLVHEKWERSGNEHWYDYDKRGKLTRIRNVKGRK